MKEILTSVKGRNSATNVQKMMCYNPKLNLVYINASIYKKKKNLVKFYQQGAQWLSGRVLDSRPKGSGFEPHRRHCVVVLEQDTFILA